MVRAFSFSTSACCRAFSAAFSAASRRSAASCSAAYARSSASSCARQSQMKLIFPPKPLKYWQNRPFPGPQ